MDYLQAVEIEIDTQRHKAKRAAMAAAREVTLPTDLLVVENR